MHFYFYSLRSERACLIGPKIFFGKLKIFCKFSKIAFDYVKVRPILRSNRRALSDLREKNEKSSGLLDKLANSISSKNKNCRFMAEVFYYERKLLIFFITNQTLAV